MTQRIELFSIGLKDLMLFSLTQRIELFFDWDWQNWTFFLAYDSENWNFSRVFFYMSTFFKNDAENWTLFFIEYDAKNWTLFSLNVTSRIWTFFLNMTQRIEPFSYLTQRNEFLISLIWKTPRIVFSNKKYSMNWTFWNMTQRIEHLNHVSKKRLREWNSFKNDFFEITHRIEPLFWTFSRCLKELKSFFNGTQRIEPFLEPLFHLNYFFTRLKELNFFRNLTRRVESFLIWLKELDFFFLNVTRRIEPFFKCDSKNWTFFQMWLKNWTFFSNVTQRIEPLFWIWFRELNFCQINTTQSQRIELFFNTTQRIEHFFCMWFMFSNDLKNWFIFGKILKELIFHMTQRMVLDAKTWNLCFWNLIQRFGLFFFWWLADLKLFFFQKLWRKELNLFVVWRRELSFFF